MSIIPRIDLGYPSHYPNNESNALQQILDVLSVSNAKEAVAKIQELENRIARFLDIDMFCQELLHEVHEIKNALGVTDEADAVAEVERLKRLRTEAYCAAVAGEQEQ